MENLKTVILTNNQNRDFKAILNLKRKEGNIKFFSPSIIKTNLALGIKQGADILKIPLEIKDNNCLFSLPKEVDNASNLMCAVVDVSNAFCPQIVLSGSVNRAQENNKIESAFVQTKPSDVSTLYEQDTDAEIESLIDTNIQDDAKSVYYDSCAGCKYRKAFYDEGCSCAKVNSVSTSNTENAQNSQIINNFGNIGVFERNGNTENMVNNCITENSTKNNLTGDNSTNNDNLINNDDKAFNTEAQNFYYQVKPQVDALFERYQPDETLNGIIANSKWVRVAYDGGQDYYVLGLIFNQQDNSQVDFICYGVPSPSPDNPPEDIREYAQWLPANVDVPQGQGYFIVYQNAITGETVNVDFI